MDVQEVERTLKKLQREGGLIGAMVLLAENALPVAYVFDGSVPPESAEILLASVYEIVSGAIEDAFSVAMEIMGKGKPRLTEVSINLGSLGILARKMSRNFIFGILFSPEKTTWGWAQVLFREYSKFLEEILA